MPTINLGQVSAIFVGTSAPTANLNMLWRDTSAALHVFKAYNTQTSMWEPLSTGGSSGTVTKEINAVFERNLTAPSYTAVTRGWSSGSIAIPVSIAQPATEKFTLITPDTGVETNYDTFSGAGSLSEFLEGGTSSEVFLLRINTPIVDPDTEIGALIITYTLA